MKVNTVAQHIYAVATVLNANNRLRDTSEPGHDPDNMLKDFTYLEGDDFKTARILRCVLLASAAPRWNVRELWCELSFIELPYVCSLL
ncbi:jg927 [Pararge aegeria aegeria]|uniref:Jg927 protein n=1 Tax=Pararge aegeria aegeria TaxID=348720 RepID=A0A8S4R9E5_9NEOP|nr:jg927 [Pararge aegeria aegeria]